MKKKKTSFENNRFYLTFVFDLFNSLIELQNIRRQRLSQNCQTKAKKPTFLIPSCRMFPCRI
jgi:hypothetical protein